MLLWREFVRFFLILFRVLLLLGGKSYWERLKNETMWGKALSHIGIIHHVPPHTEKNNPNGVGAWFITFRISGKWTITPTSWQLTGCGTRWLEHRGWNTEAERDKSRPYAIRDFPFFRRVVNAKFHGFCPSESSDERKMRKMTFPPRRKNGKR